MDLEAGATKMDVLQRDDLSFPQSLPEFQRLFPNEKSIPLFQQFARNHPARGDDVHPVSTVVAAGRRSAIRTRH